MNMGSSRQREERVRQLADALRRRLPHYLPGTRLPNRHELADYFKSSVREAREAVELLADEGLVECRPRGGTFVKVDSIASPAVRRVVAVTYRFPTPQLHQQEILLGANRQCDQRGLEFDVEYVESGNPPANRLADFIRSDDPSIGYMLVNVRPPEEMIRTWHIESLPFVVVDDYPRGLAVHTVLADFQGGAYRAVEILALLGHRRIAYIGRQPRPEHPPSLRLLGYHLGMQRHGLGQEGERIAMEIGSTDSTNTRRLLRERFAQGNLPTAVVADNLRVGCDVLAVSGQMDIEVPAQLSVVAVGIRRHELPPLVDGLSHVDLGEPELLGRSAVDVLAQFPDSTTPTSLTLSCRWVDRGSVARPRP